jgi:hypothetical protein
MSNETKEAYTNYLKNPDNISKKTATRYLRERGFDVNNLRIQLIEALEFLRETKLELEKVKTRVKVSATK